jgi:two-component system cell cycle sensor histidine kinase/response regulator CckA
VLVVDDEPAIRGVASRALTTRGYTVLTATDADHALGVLRDHPGPIDLLLTDHVMPGLSGEELIARARALRPALRAALMSGYSSLPAGAPIAEAQGLAFLPKPFAVDALAALVARLMAATP